MQLLVFNLIMRHKQTIKNGVRNLRSMGFSLGQIHEKTGVPKTTIRTWIKDIVLSEKQQQLLKERIQKFLQKGRIEFQKIQKDRRSSKEKELLEKGINEIGKLSSRDLLIAGIALYWAEGFKNRHEHRLGFCNSDPSMIKFYIHWLEQCLGISRDQLVARLTLNCLYKDKVNGIQNFWAQTIGVSISQFSKPFFQASKWKKQYNTNNYHGVLRVHVKESLDHLLKMKGWIEGLKMLK